GCDNLADKAPALAGWSCTDAKPIRMTASGRDDPPVDPTLDLVVTCRQGDDTALFHLHGGPDGYGDDGRQPFRKVDNALEVEVGDVTGDSVDDIILLHGSIDALAVEVLPQCQASDHVCRGL